jgi:hypothetical protein
MTEAETLIREIESLRETIRREWFNIRLDTLTHDDRVVIRDHIERCHADLKSCWIGYGIWLTKNQVSRRYCPSHHHVASSSTTSERFAHCLQGARLLNFPATR